MEPLDFFDSSCFFGMRGIVNNGSFFKLEDLLKHMELYGIKKALVYHSMEREYNPLIGNQMLMDEIKNYPFLYPVWTVMPHHTGEFDEPEILIGKMKENNVKVVRMFPGAGDHNYSLSPWNCGELLSTLEKYRVILMLGIEQTSFDELYSLCKTYPDLKIILTGVTYRMDRNLYPLVKELPNLYIETLGYKPFDGIEEFCKRFGARRLIFGSGMPVFSGGAAVCMINYARISQKEKRMIACENLENLLEGVQL